jgi:hypothetical protein
MSEISGCEKDLQEGFNQHEMIAVLCTRGGGERSAVWSATWPTIRLSA